MWADFYKGISLSLSNRPKPRLIKLMFLSGTLSHRRIRPRFWLFLLLAAVMVAFLMGAIQIPDSLATSVYWQEVLQ
jgi:hypothetical protein